jgi:serine/threonine protein kinase
MEFVPGQSLDKQLKNQGAMPLAPALRVFGQVAEALGFIHQNQLIHRDIKPGNILIDPAGEAKLADLGLIKDLDSLSFLTNSKTGLGTLEFAAPEQFDDAKNVDLRCDIYALAASLYLALTGNFPFGRGSQMRVLKHKLDHQFTPLAQLVAGISPALDQIVIRALHPDPNIRPASTTEFLKGMMGQEAPHTLIQPKPMPTGPAPPRERHLAPLDGQPSNGASGTSAGSSSSERRRKRRHAVKIDTTLGIVSAAKHESWPAQVTDISPSGLCLQCGRRFEPNTRLNVLLPELDSGRQSARLVQVCWAKIQPDKTWLLGCLFATALEHEDLERFLVGDLAKTVMLRKATV